MQEGEAGRSEVSAGPVADRNARWSWLLDARVSHALFAVYHAVPKGILPTRRKRGAFRQCAGAVEIVLVVMHDLIGMSDGQL